MAKLRLSSSLVHAIAGVFRGDRHFLEGAVAIGIEVLAGRNGEVHVGRVEAFGRLVGRWRIAGRLALGGLGFGWKLTQQEAGRYDQDDHRRIEP